MRAEARGLRVLAVAADGIEAREVAGELLGFPDIMNTEIPHAVARRPRKFSKALDSKRPTIESVMTTQPYTIGRDQTLATGHAIMRSHRIRHLPVLEHGEIVGVLTQRDLYFLESISGVDIATDRVDDAMSPDSYTVSPDTPVAKVVSTMFERHLGCAVVVERGRVAGIFTASDALRLLGVLLSRRQDGE